MHRRSLHLVAFSALVPVLGAAPGDLPATARVSVATGGVQSNDVSSDISRNRPSISGDGRFVAFQSTATNLVAGDTNGAGDIFVHDRWTGLTTRVSVSSLGAQATSESLAPEITPDGRFVLFTSSANNLTPGDANNSEDVFVHDRLNATTTLVSMSLGGASAAGQSGIGPYESFYRRPISADGRFVAFSSNAGDLVVGDTNFAPDVFVRDLVAATTTRVSVDASGAQVSGSSSAPSMSADGRWIAFESSASGLVPGDTNGATDVFVKDRLTGAIVRASTSSTGAQADFFSFDPSLSSDGRIVAFQSAATQLVPGDTNGVHDVFVKRLDTGVIERVSVRPGGAQCTTACEGPMLSRDGRFVAFWSWDPLLVAGDVNGAPDVFVRDLALGATRLGSLSELGAHADARSWFPDLSSNGLAIVFSSAASNLTPGDTNNRFDVFVRDEQLAGPTPFCSAKRNSAGCIPRIAASGAPTVGPGAFVITATDVLNNKNGLLFYGFGHAAAPFLGGTLCVQLPTRRTPLSNSFGNPPPDDCSGAYAFDMHAWIASGSDAQLAVGARVAAQFWSRDPASSHGAGLSDALAFAVCP